MEILAGVLLLTGGHLLNNKDTKLNTRSKQNGGDQLTILNKIGTMKMNNDDLSNDQRLIANSFNLHFFKKKEISNPNFKENTLYKGLDNETISKIKSRVNVNKKLVDHQINDVGFQTANTLEYEGGNSYQNIPSIDDIEKDVQLTHNNMTPFFGSSIKQNINDTGTTQHVLEQYTGNYRHTRRDNKQEVEYLFDPSPNEAYVYGSNNVTNRDQTRFFPSATGKKHNELPFEQINVGKGIANGYTARPNGGFHQDVRILPKTTDELRVNPKITYEARILPGKFPTEKGRLIGRQILKKPKAIMYNWHGERNFTTTGAHRKNKQRPDIIFKCTNRDKLHRPYNGIAAPTTKSQNTPDTLRGKKRISHRKNFLNTPNRNLTQVTGKRMNDLGKSSYWNKPTERSMQSTRVHYTNVVSPTRGQQYYSDSTRYTRRQDTIDYGRPEGKAGPHRNTMGPVYDQNEIMKTTIRETTEDNLHHGWVGDHQRKGQVYDQNEQAKTTIRETTENNLHHGWINEHRRVGKVYNQNETAKTTIRETTEDNLHHGWVGDHQRKGQVYDQNETAKTTIRETTENNLHHGWVGDHQRKGQVYDQNETAKTTIRETTEDNLHEGWVGSHKRKGKVYNQNEIA